MTIVEALIKRPQHQRARVTHEELRGIKVVREENRVRYRTVNAAISGPTLVVGNSPRSSRRRPYTQSVPEAIATMPPARPSSPSMRLTALHSANTHTAVMIGSIEGPRR